MNTVSKTSHFLSVCSANFKRLEKVIDLKTLNDVEILLNKDSSKAKFKIIQKSNHTLILDASYVSPNEILEFSFRLHFYIDAENLLANEIPVPPEYGLLRDSNQNVIIPRSLIEVESDNRTSIIPSVGFVFYF